MLPTDEFQLFKRLWPHFLIVSAATGYLLLGGYLFFLIETRWAVPKKSIDSTDQFLYKKSSRGGGGTEGLLCPTVDTVQRLQEASLACTWRLIPKANQSHSTTITSSTPRSVGDSAHSRKRHELSLECETALIRLTECLQRRTNHRVPGQLGGGHSGEEWTWSTGIILAFTIVTTIGYGEVTPQTSAGRVFCIIYGIFGIPLVLLTLANQGRFFSAWLLYSYKSLKRFFRYIRQKGFSCFFRRSSSSIPTKQTTGNHHHHSTTTPGLTLNGLISSLDDSNSLASSEDNNVEQTIPASVLLCIISGYLALGGYLIGQWESEEHWSFIDCTYFVFTSAASIGFGDVVPRNRSRLALTFLYICLGLALTTTAIDIFAEYLRRLHYWGVKIKNVASTFVWFGGNKVTINQLVRTIGHELGASEDKIKTIVRHLDSVVSMAIQEADEQQEIVEDLQFVEPFVPAANERLLVHQNSFEFGIAEANLLSPLIFSPPDHQQQHVVVNNNEKRPSLTSMESLKSSTGDNRQVVRTLKRASTGGSETIQFIDSCSVTMPTSRKVTRSTASVQSTSTARNESPRELIHFITE